MLRRDTTGVPAREARRQATLTLVAGPVLAPPTTSSSSGTTVGGMTSAGAFQAYGILDATLFDTFVLS